MNSLSTGNYQVVTQAHKGSQLANLLIRAKRSIEQAEAVKLLNPLAIEHVGFGSAWHMLDMACIDHSNFKASKNGFFSECWHRSTLQSGIIDGIFLLRTFIRQISSSLRRR